VGDERPVIPGRGHTAAGFRFSTGLWRTCDACEGKAQTVLASEMLARLGITDDPEDPDVSAALATMPWHAWKHPSRSEPADRQHMQVALQPTKPLGRSGQQPWDFLDAQQVRAAITAVRQEREAALVRRRCAVGPCCGCGVNLATGWTDHGTLTPEGRTLVLCRQCSALWLSAGESFHDGGWQDLLCADALGVEPLMGLGSNYAFVPFHAATGVEPDGYPERFGYLPVEALSAARSHVWTRFPRQAPAEWRERHSRAQSATLAMAQARPIMAPAIRVPQRSE